MDARDHPRWCARHTSARCRSAPVEVVWRSGPVCVELAVGLERWVGRETAACLYVPATPLLLPRHPAVELGTAWVGLLEQAGWVSRTGS